MKYYSSRNNLDNKKSSEAIIKGISDDGGLYTPHLNDLKRINLEELKDKSYKELALEIFKLFFDDYKEEDLIDVINSAYNNKIFSSEEIVETIKINNDYLAKLYLGPTSAFKDLALTVLPHLMTKAYKYSGLNNPIYILTATSGDTGKAALSGFKDVSNTYISVLYPYKKVSKMQELQMATSEGKNVDVLAIRGNFDDCQRLVKEIFNESSDELKINLSSANSINLGRLIPQSVYYFKAYFDVLRNKDINIGDKVNFVVPCGNFGNILAGFIAKSLGLPINKLIVATNSNQVLADFIDSGIYDSNRPFYKTISPSMDILVASNIERLLYILSDYDDELVKSYMNDLKNKGYYEVNDKLKKALKDNFVAYHFNDEDTKKTIKDIYRSNGYILDPHSAVAYSAAIKHKKIDNTLNIVLATASAYKFPKDVIEAIEGRSLSEEKALERLKELASEPIPLNIDELNSKPILHKTVLEKAEVKEYFKRRFGELS